MHKQQKKEKIIIHKNVLKSTSKDTMKKSEKTIRRTGENICNHMSDRCLLSTVHKTFHCSTTKGQKMSFKKWAEDE